MSKTTAVNTAIIKSENLIPSNNTVAAISITQMIPIVKSFEIIPFPFAYQVKKAKIGENNENAAHPQIKTEE